MTNTLLNISGKIDLGTVALYKMVSNATAQLAIPFVVVGVSARDIVLHYGHGARIQRATDMRGRDAKDLRYLFATYEKNTGN